MTVRRAEIVPTFAGWQPLARRLLHEGVAPAEVEWPEVPAEAAVQCGYCINGMIMQAKAMLDSRRTAPSEREIRRRSRPTCAAAGPTRASSPPPCRARGPHGVPGGEESSAVRSSGRIGP
jgi:hypothetical protein